MAIVVEEEKRKVDLVRVFGWIAVIGVLGFSIYYLFVAAPELVAISPPDDFQLITPIAQVSLHPEDVLNSGPYLALKVPIFPLPTPNGPAAVGRQNPFVP